MFHQDKYESASQTSFWKKPRSQWLILVITFLYLDELEKVWLNQREAEGGISLLLSLYVAWLPGHIFTPVDSHVASNQILGFFHPAVLRALSELACLGTDSPSKVLTSLCNEIKADLKEQ